MCRIQSSLGRWFNVHPSLAIVAVAGTLGCQGQPVGNAQSVHARAALGVNSTSPLTTALDENAWRSVITPLLASYLNAIPVGREKDFGFNSRDEFPLSELGRPFGVFNVEGGLSVTFLGYWVVPILIGGQARAMLDIRLGDGGYFIGGFGSATFAPILQTKAAALGIAITGPSDSAALLRTLVPRNDYLVCATAGGPPASVDQIRALKFNMIPPNSGSASKANTDSTSSCLALADIPVGDNSN